MRVGLGYDIHKLVGGRKLILGGVHIPHNFGLLGHSDADVLIHAIMDAILGAIGEKDIGNFFPNTDEFQNISSLILLEKVKQILKNKQYKIINIDSVIIAQEPKVSPFINDMKKNIANILQISPNDIGIKATTNEELDDIGNKKGIIAQAIVLVDKI